MYPNWGGVQPGFLPQRHPPLPSLSPNDPSLPTDLHGLLTMGVQVLHLFSPWVHPPLLGPELACFVMMAIHSVLLSHRATLIIS